MKELLKLPLYLSLALFLGITACGDDDDDDDVDCDELGMSLEAEAENISSALTDLITEESAENCEAFITALDDYIDLIEEGRSCLSADEQADLDEALEQWEESRELFSCDS